MEAIRIQDGLSFIDFSASHSVLLLRNTKFSENGHVNTDLLFQATFYVELITYMQEVIIDLGDYNDINYVKNKLDLNYAETVRADDIYAIKCSGKKYYIGARRLEIFQNTLPPNETSIGSDKL